MHCSFGGWNKVTEEKPVLFYFFFKKCKLTKLKLLFKEEIRYQCGFFL